MTSLRIAGGAPIIKGTRIAVRAIVGYYQLGMSTDEILQSLPHLTQSQVHAALAQVAGRHREPMGDPAKPPAVAVKKSITSDHLVCLEDGKKFKSLKRHVRSQYDMSPEQYREKWGLPADYPMVAPNYAQARSRLAKAMGLGSQRRRRAK